MTNICKFTVPASRDIENIIDYIAENSSFDGAESLLSKINSQCERLAKFPGMGRRRDELAANVRSFPVNDYLIFYRPIEEDIEILRVVSGYRDLEELFLKDDEDRIYSVDWGIEQELMPLLDEDFGDAVLSPLTHPTRLGTQ